MPATYTYRLLNVFAESTFGGNPLCVFEDARGLDEATMQALALQFNLSETTFIFPSTVADARVRIFTPDFEMRFAGHPTLGTAPVVRDLLGCDDALCLEVKAGVVPVEASGNVWTLTAPCPAGPRTTPSPLSRAEVAALLALDESDLTADPMWVDTGAEHFMIPLRSPEAVRRAQPDSSRLRSWPVSSLGRRTAYVFAFDDEAPGQVLARYFYPRQGGVAEDPGTGSACANLGGWLMATGHALPARYAISQGAAVDRPSRLYLDVSAAGAIQVGGRVIEIGRGTVTIDPVGQTMLA
ncbi:PhzF family phenazine biosynthesis protein [Herbaspirillum rubrisubalbicans]|uniref:PhzF family phenazine biosynthesis protein n=1 Tax=Herbaspirillum rubrisubalbicans Os34 TaxID=1235827 RepID=A0A6M3ZT29_9BURK|nr:PhzF family phenazine biosynthesis protein [Herbaspirillum rubrisubalbicans]QJQ01423.1 PhzF family phenazine biosynthesis protein [Herbaspirillum rubrisubalbicans Os34]